MNAAEFVSRLGATAKPTPTANGWGCRCPAHDDGKASLCVSQASDRVLIHCQAGCTAEAVCEAAGVKLADLFNDAKPERNGKAAPRRNDSLDWPKCLAAFTEAEAQKLAAWRGLSVEFVRWLHQQGTVGISVGKLALANHGGGGKVVPGL